MFRRKFLSIVLLAGMLSSQAVPRALAATYCDQAQFISDLTAPDGSSFAPGAVFTKTWRLMNIGTCAWNTSYSLVWVGGDPVGAPLSVKLPVNVIPGQMVDVSVNLTAPTTTGHYKGLFKINNTSGAQFGIGDSASNPFWADFNVIEVNATIYDFLANASYAQWKSGAGLLPFPGTSGDGRGFAYQVNNPHFEDDSFDSSPGLLVVPQNKFNGYLQATYPEFQIQSGDHLQTLVNCEFGATSCYVTFRIDYLLPNGVQKTLWTWKEAYDKRFYRANIDLSSLAGQKIRFVFMLLSSGLASGDRAIWGSPRIVRAGTTQPPAPPSTLTPLPALTPTATPFNQPPPTISASACDKAAFVTDVTVPDGNIFSPGAAFTKTWRLKNVGSCIWTTSYKLVYYSGEQMSAPTAVNLPWGAAFGQTVDISINMVAPMSAGKFRGYWILTNANGQFFGIGPDASKPIWVEINVAGNSPIGTGYDFTSNVCSAEWKSGAGILPCPGTNGSTNGFIIQQNAPKLEDGSTGSPGLLTVPQNRFNGYIQGFYPAFTVQPGDKFQSTVSCEFGVIACYVNFRLDYMTANGFIGTFWQWREQSDGKVYNANIDLSPLAGRSVRFILTTLATGTATNDRALWGSPRIVRAAGAPPTIPAPPTANWPAYINSTYGFNFKYPPGSERFFETTNNILINMPIAPGTNLREKYLQMSVNENVNPCQSPLSDTSRPGSPTETVVFNGISFLKQIGGDANVGHLHEWVGYSTLKNNACISMDFVLHSLAAGNFATPVPEFDKVAESAVFAQVMSTFAWNAPPTPTATPTPTSTSAPPTVAPPPVVSSPQINKLSMIDASNGWALGNAYVLRTTNGGATWYNVTPPGAAGRITGSFFPNINTGWVLISVSPPGPAGPGSLYRTTDGGLNWMRFDVPFNSGYIQFLDNTHGFVMLITGAATSKQSIEIYQTSDGGATWVRNYTNDPTVPGAGNTLPLGGHKNGMAFRDTTTGWVGGDTPADGFVYLYKTTNSGVTWSQQPLALPAGYESAFIIISAPKFFGTNDAVLPVLMGTNTGIGVDLFIYVSHNGGATWTRSSASIHQAYNTDFISVNNGFAWDPTGLFHFTSNAGGSWSNITPNVNFGDSIRDMDFVSNTTGWVLDADLNGNSALYRTTDGGATWTLLFGQPPVTQVLPDLTITGMNIQLQNPSCFLPGDPLGVSLGIQNIGQAAAGTFTVTVNGLQQIVETLGAGETLILFFPNSNNPVTAMVDASSAITESDENNNSRSEMVPVPTAPLPCPTNTPNGPQDFNTFGQSIVDALNTRNFDLTKSLMDQSFGFGFWQSQGFSNTPDLAVQQLQNNYIGPNTHLTPDPSKDLTALLGGLNPYSIMGLDPSSSQALFVSGWGLDGKGEAILYITRLPLGNLSWNSVLIAPTGFAPNTSANDFCADPRIPALIEQLKGSMNQSNGDMFAALVSPTHGVDVRLWAYASPINFNTITAKTVFTSTDVYNWGGGPSGQPDSGTFAQVIQPKMQEVFNALNMETYCDNLTKVFPLATPWPYPNIHYYNLYKPATSINNLDFRTWLIGFEYINNQPYLYAMVTIIWEP